MTAPAGADGDPAVVATAQGRVRGVELDGLRRWRGIPYADPPAGPLRFRPPQPVAAWRGIRDAAALAPVAWQSDSVNSFTGAPAGWTAARTASTST